MDAEAYIEERSDLIDGWLDEFVPPVDEPPCDLHAAMRHLLFPGGKRLRPMLAMAAAEAVGSPPAVALPVAAAVELVHTYSLVHDDLPCMDDDDVRRGLPTVHVAFDEATAVLAGDALQALAFEAAAQACPEDAPRARAALADLARAAGSRGIVGGQVDDIALASADAPATLNKLLSIHARKSAALIAASIVSGAHLGGADADTIDRLQRCGETVGVAFQIADDVLDEGEEDPCSLVRAIGIDAARERAESLLADALDEMAMLGERAEPLRALVRFAVRRHE